MKNNCGEIVCCKTTTHRSGLILNHMAIFEKLQHTVILTCCPHTVLYSLQKKVRDQHNILVSKI